MNELTHIETVEEMAKLLGISHVLHGGLTVETMSRMPRAKLMDNRMLSFGFYMVVYKKSFCGNLAYGQTSYDYSDGTMLFVAPHQSVRVAGLSESTPEGCILMFHPELLRSTPLDRRMRDYSFFGYSANEALHLSKQEIEPLLQLFAAVGTSANRKEASSVIGKLLDQCRQLYLRQFGTRLRHSANTVGRFEQLVDESLSETDRFGKGLPSIASLAGRLCLSPNYLGDLIKNATGMSAKKLIEWHVIEEAKRRLTASEQTVKETAYSLGFEYPQYFSQMFKSRAGMTPARYKATFKNQ